MSLGRSVQDIGLDTARLFPSHRAHDIGGPLPRLPGARPAYSPDSPYPSDSSDSPSSPRSSIDLAGLTPGSGHDQLTVSGTATLGGTLALQPTGGFTPTLGDTFQILTCGTACTGTFDSVAGTDIGGSLVLEVMYGANDVTVEVVVQRNEGGPRSVPPRPL